MIDREHLENYIFETVFSIEELATIMTALEIIMRADKIGNVLITTKTKLDCFAVMGSILSQTTNGGAE